VFDKNFSLLIFVIKNLHGIKGLSLTVGSVIFGKKGVIFFLSCDKGIWLQALDMRID
jgi:hypothetical protein